MLAGLALGVKYPALVWVGLLGLAMAGACLCAGRFSERRLRHVLIFGLAALLVGGGWYLRAGVYTGNPVHPFFRHLFGGAGIDDVLDPIKRPLAPTPWKLLTALGPMTLDPDRFDSFAHQFGPAFLLFLPGVFLFRPPRRVLALVALGWSFLTLCLTARQSMRFVLLAVGPMAVGVAWLAACWWDRRTIAARLLGAAVLLIVGFEAMIAVGHARHGLTVVLGRESAESYLAQHEPTWRVGRWIDKNLPAEARLVGQDHRGYYLPRPYTMELAHRRRTGLGTRGVGRPDRGTPAEVRFHAPVALSTGAGECCRVRPDALASACALVGRSETALPRGFDRWRWRRAALCDLCSDSRQRAADSRPNREGTPMNRSPTLSELRVRVQKDRHREIGNWLARRWGRPTAVYGTWLAVRLGLSANQVTLLALLAGLASAVAVASGSRTGFVAGAALAHLAFWLDHVDGQVARWRGTAGLGGVYFDYVMHHAQTLALGFGLGYGLAARSGDVRWAAAGFTMAVGWMFLGLHNDCRYKAFFQRLKVETRTFRVDGGAGGRPAPAAPWPRRGWGMLTWPAFKACEPHVVLMGITALAVLALAAPRLWVVFWTAGVRGMAVGAPLLACARVARALARDAVKAEFDRWFQPCEREAG